MDILSILIPYQDLNYKKFHEKICSTKYEIVGIKIPTLRKLSKYLLKTYEVEEIFNSLNNNYYECVMLQGLIIANLKVDYKTKVEMINSFLPKIDNWAICDIFCGELKFIKNNQKEFLKYINNCLKKKQEYIIRFGIVCLINYYINDNYIDYILEKMLSIQSDYYYVKIAVSWTLSVCATKYFEKTYEYLKVNKNVIEPWIFNKTIQKCIESYRLNKDQKELLKKLKN